MGGKKKRAYAVREVTKKPQTNSRSAWLSVEAGKVHDWQLRWQNDVTRERRGKEGGEQTMRSIWRVVMASGAEEFAVAVPTKKKKKGKGKKEGGAKLGEMNGKIRNFKRRTRPPLSGGDKST